MTDRRSVAAENQRVVLVRPGVRSRSFLPGLRNRFTGETVHHVVEHPVPCLFALSSDLRGPAHSEFQRIRDSGFLTPGGLKAICIAGRGSWLCAGNSWHSVPMVQEHAEIAGFVCGVSSALVHIASTRGWPEVSNYVFRPDEMFTPAKDALYVMQT